MSHTEGQGPTTARKEPTVIHIKERDVRIAYEVDEKPISEVAEVYGIDWTDMKKVLTDFKIAIRRDGEERPEPAKSYKVVLHDYDKATKTHSERVATPVATVAKPVNAAV